jgi:hypothetical protein
MEDQEDTGDLNELSGDVGAGWKQRRERRVEGNDEIKVGMMMYMTTALCLRRNFRSQGPFSIA